MSRTSLLFRLTPGYGLGDVVQQTAVLRHLRHYRPDWDVDFCGDAQKSDCMLGLCRAVYAHGQEPPEAAYDRVADVDLYDTLAGWRDRPNTRVSAVLHEKFGLDWVRELGQYRIKIQTPTYHRAENALFSYRPAGPISFLHDSRQFKLVAVHYSGDSASDRKNLTDGQSIAICKHVEMLGYVPMLLDWYGKSMICSGGGIKSVAHYPWPSDAGASAELNAAIIDQCAAFIGIDSGPSKVAAATDTPAIVCWTGNHPALYFDPSPNVTHLVPARHGDNDMLARSGPQARENALAFFRENYNFRFYQSPEDLPHAVKRWLNEVL